MSHRNQEKLGDTKGGTLHANAMNAHSGIRGSCNEPVLSNRSARVPICTLCAGAGPRAVDLISGIKSPAARLHGGIKAREIQLP